jgi:signal peptidase I
MDLAQPEALDRLADLLANGAAVRVVVTGDSMRPFLRGGETVTLRRVNPAAIRCGDLVLCRQTSGKLLLHRVVRILRGRGLPARFQTQGDALWTLDEPVTSEQALGRVAAVERDGAFVDLTATRWLIYGCCIVVFQRLRRRAQLARSRGRRTNRAFDHQDLTESVCPSQHPVLNWPGCLSRCRTFAPGKSC